MSDASGEVVERDQSEGAESPEDEGVGDAWQRALGDHFRLEHHFGEEVPDAFADGVKRETGIRFGRADFAHYFSEAMPESIGGGGEKS
jgi:hypothetical protein